MQAVVRFMTNIFGHTLMGLDENAENRTSPR